MIGKRVKLARSAAGLSLRDLETKIGNRVTAQAISKYERDESMPGSDVLIALADALGVSVDYLLGDRDMVLESVEFRKKKLTSRREEAQVEARVLHLLERYLTVEELLGLSSVAGTGPGKLPGLCCAIWSKSKPPRAASVPIGVWGSIRSQTWLNS